MHKQVEMAMAEDGRVIDRLREKCDQLDDYINRERDIAQQYASRHHIACEEETLVDRSVGAKQVRRTCVNAITTRLQYVLRLSPGINFVYNLILDDSDIAEEGVKKLLDVLGLLNGLLMGAVLTMQSSVTYDELIAADVRFTNSSSTAYDEYWAKRWVASSVYPSKALYEYSAISLVFIFLGVLIVVYVYADSLSKSGDDEEQLGDDEAEGAAAGSGNVIVVLAADIQDKEFFIESLTQKISGGNGGASTTQARERRVKLGRERNRAYFDAWWKFSKYAMLLVIFTTCGACIYGVLAVLMLYLIKYPDYYIAENGDVSYSFASNLSPTGRIVMIFFYFFLACAGWTALTCGCGTTAHYILRYRHKYEDKIKGIKQEKKKSLLATIYDLFISFFIIHVEVGALEKVENQVQAMKG